ncbi:MAG: hypothetical protein AABZ00_02775 [Chloroflexota bacterium]
MTNFKSKLSLAVQIIIFILGVLGVSWWYFFDQTNKMGGDLFLSLGSTFIATSLLMYINQIMGIKNIEDQLRDIQEEIKKQILEIQNNSVLLKKFIENGVVDFWIERRQIENNMWNTFTENVRDEVWLFGVAEYGYAVDQTFAEILKRSTDRGCNYKILLLDESSIHAKNWDEPDPSIVSSKIRSATHRFQELMGKYDDNKGKIELRVYDDIPSMSIVKADDEMLVTLFIPSLQRDNSPTFRVKAIHNGMFSHYEKHFSNIWGKAKPIRLSR